MNVPFLELAVLTARNRMRQEQIAGDFTDAQLTALEGAIKHLDSALCCLEDYTAAGKEDK